MSTRERLIFILCASLFFLAGELYLATKTIRKTRNLHELYERIIYSSASYYDADNHSKNVYDGDLKTAWREAPPPGALIRTNQLKMSNHPENPEPDPSTLQLTMEVGLTHYPDRPPRKNPLKALMIWSGDQSNPEKFMQFARPARIRLLFFRQGLIDMDREYRLPREPELWKEMIVTLEDKSGQQQIDLSTLPGLDESPQFHKNIYMLWLRVIVESFYPGSDFRNEVAISEIKFERVIPETSSKP